MMSVSVIVSVSAIVVGIVLGAVAGWLIDQANGHPRSLGFYFFVACAFALTVNTALLVWKAAT